jgi:hypothetical protein
MMWHGREEDIAKLEELAGDAKMLVRAAALAISHGPSGSYDGVFHLAGNLSRDEAQAAAAILAIGAAEMAAGIDPEQAS